MESPDQTRLVRKLRIALVLVAMLVGVAVIAVIGVLFYWNSYLLGSRGDDPFTRGPYVVGLTSTGAEVRFLGPDPSKVTLTAVAPDGTSVVAKDGKFIGLESGQRYLWTATVDGIGQASGSFLTAPTDPQATVTFGVIADYGSGNEHEFAVGRGLAAIDPSFVATAGDNSYMLAVPALFDRNVFTPLQDVMAEAPLMAVLGDHDTFIASGGEALADALALPGGALHYTYEYGPVQMIALGVDGDAKAIAYAKAQLAKPWPGPRFAVMHTPLQPGDPLADVLRGKVDAVFSGHLHRYERRTVDGVLQIVAGNGGQGPGNVEFTKASSDAVFTTMDYGFVRVIAGPMGSTIQMIDEAGALRDSVTVPPR